MDGTERMILVHHLSHPWGIAVYESFLYYADEQYEVIERVDKSSGANKVTLRDNVPNLRGLRVYHRRSKYLSLKHTHTSILHFHTYTHFCLWAHANVCSCSGNCQKYKTTYKTLNLLWLRVEG